MCNTILGPCTDWHCFPNNFGTVWRIETILTVIVMKAYAHAMVEKGYKYFTGAARGRQKRKIKRALWSRNLTIEYRIQTLKLNSFAKLCQKCAAWTIVQAELLRQLSCPTNIFNFSSRQWKFLNISEAYQ